MISKSSILLLGAVLSLCITTTTAYAEDDTEIDNLFQKLQQLEQEKTQIEDTLRQNGIFAEDDETGLEQWLLEDKSPSRTKRCADDCTKTMKIRAAYEYPRWCVLDSCYNQHIKGSWSPNVSASSPDVDVEVDVISARHTITPYFIATSDTRPVNADYQVMYHLVDDLNQKMDGKSFKLYNSFFKWFFDDNKVKQKTIKQSLPQDSNITFVLDVVGLR